MGRCPRGTPPPIQAAWPPLGVVNADEGYGVLARQRGGKSGDFTVTVTRMLTVRLVFAAPRGHRIRRAEAQRNGHHRELPVAGCGP